MQSIIHAAFKRPGAIIFMIMIIFGVGLNAWNNIPKQAEPDIDIPILADLYKTKLLPLEKLVTKKYKLDDINIALDDLKNSKVFRPLIVIDEF